MALETAVRGHTRLNSWCLVGPDLVLPGTVLEVVSAAAALHGPDHMLTTAHHSSVPLDRHSGHKAGGGNGGSGYNSGRAIATGRRNSSSFRSKGSAINSGGVRGCLLYTSPSPRDRQKSRMPSSA